MKHTHRVGQVVIMAGVKFPLIIDALIPGIDIAVVRRVFGETTANVRASDLTPVDQISW
jgi:hypothetical protein